MKRLAADNSAHIAGLCLFRKMRAHVLHQHVRMLSAPALRGCWHIHSNFNLDPILSGAPRAGVGGQYAEREAAAVRAASVHRLWHRHLHHCSLDLTGPRVTGPKPQWPAGAGRQDKLHLASAVESCQHPWMLVLPLHPYSMPSALMVRLGRRQSTKAEQEAEPVGAASVCGRQRRL